jgi:hypothetical protein
MGRTPMKKSRIRILPDQREICTGYQWEKRKRELRERAVGFCEAGQIIPGHESHFIGSFGDAHHIVKRSKARDDRLQNLLWICRAAHIEIDNRKVQWTKKERDDA